MNRLSIVLVIAFASYSLSAPENSGEFKHVNVQTDCPSQISYASPEKPELYPGAYLESYEVGYGNFTEKGFADITLKIHTAPQGAVKMDGMPWGKIVCGAKCAVSCFKGKNTSACLKCMAGCLLE